jgi:hypothetical protein
MKIIWDFERSISLPRVLHTHAQACYLGTRRLTGTEVVYTVPGTGPGSPGPAPGSPGLVPGKPDRSRTGLGDPGAGPGATGPSVSRIASSPSPYTIEPHRGPKRLFEGSQHVMILKVFEVPSLFSFPPTPPRSTVASSNQVARPKKGGFAG